MAEKASSEDYVIVTVNNPGNGAIDMAERGDILLLTDKGHDENLLVGDQAIQYSDKEIAIEQITRKFGEETNSL